MTDHHARSPVVTEDDLRAWPDVTFQVGDRVRVRLSPECPLPLYPLDYRGFVQHYPEQDGMEGTVIEMVWWLGSNPDHPYLVRLPDRSRGSWGYGAGTFAAIELEPIDGAPS